MTGRRKTAPRRRDIVRAVAPRRPCPPATSMPRPAAPSVPILMYHDVAPELHAGFERFTVRARDFAWQMRWLALTGHESITLDRLLAARRGEATLPRRPVVLTFDDAFVASGEHAPPVLRRHGFTATFFVVAGLVGR